MYNEKTEKSLFCGTFAAKQQKVQHKILTSEYTYFNRRKKWNSIAYICENQDQMSKPKITEKRKRSQGTKKSCSSLQKRESTTSLRYTEKSFPAKRLPLALSCNNYCQR